MAWFQLKNQEKRSKRKNVFLRVRSLPENVVQKIKDTKCIEENELIEFVKIAELRPNNKVLLEIWCYNLNDRMQGKWRNNVFCLEVDENPEWICESDIGRGLK